MAEISETGTVFDLLAGRSRAETAQPLRQREDDDDDRRNGRQTSETTSRSERAQETRGAAQGEQVQRFNATQELARPNNQSDNQNGLNRIIDQNGNEVGTQNEQAQSGSQVDQQRFTEQSSQREQRVDGRRIQAQAERVEQRLQEQLSRERATQAPSDPSLPRGSIVDISA